MIDCMTDPGIEQIMTGRTVVADGLLRELREDLGLTRAAMAELLHTSPITYATWENRPTTVRLWPSTAERIGRFYSGAQTVISQLEGEGIHLKNLLPLHLAATQLGLPQELILKWFREGRFEAVDLGILGLWIERDDMHLLRFNE